MIIEQKLRDIQTRAADIELQMNSGELSGEALAKLSKEYSRLNEILPLITEYFQIVSGIADANEMQHDPELRDIAVEQLNELNHALPEVEKKLQIALLPRDDADDNSVIWKFVRVLVVKNPPCLQGICIININLMHCAKDGR